MLFHCLSDAIWWKEADATLDPEILDFAFLAQIREVAAVEGLGFEEQIALDDCDSPNSRHVAHEGVSIFPSPDDYDPTNALCIRQVSQREVLELQEQLLREQIHALQRAAARLIRVGESLEVANHYEQVWKAMQKELEMLPSVDCISLPSTVDPGVDVSSNGSSSKHSQNDDLSWDEPTCDESNFSEVPSKWSQLDGICWEDMEEDGEAIFDCDEETFI